LAQARQNGKRLGRPETAARSTPAPYRCEERALNFAPGTAYSYTNTGFNIATILIERALADGKTFQEFTRDAIFKPLQMTHTRWRDDFRVVVPNRALAYGPAPGGGWIQQTPIENIIGAGGMLSTHAYEIVSLIGAGGMGEVYLARDPRLGRNVAIKVSLAQFTEPFEREERAVAALNHPDICTLYDKIARNGCLERWTIRL
jgi:CubicO group peptidase (beta-lactamase class C family)